MPVTIPATGSGTATPIVSTDNVTADSSQVQNVALVTVVAGVLARLTPGSMAAPHIGLIGDPWTLVHEGASFTSAQTSTDIVVGGASEKLVVTQCQVQAYGTTAFTCQVYFGTGSFVRGTNRTIFDGEFGPGSTYKPGAILNGPFISGTNGDDLKITTVGDGSVTVNVWYYVVT